jgi:predicted DNA-binding protein with PD1-like motif
VSRYRCLDAGVWVLACDDGDEVIAAVSALARREGLRSSRVQAIGGFSAATLGYFDVDRREYLPIEIREQCEILSLLGDVTDDGSGAPKVHLHGVLGRRDGSTRGGHVLAGTVRPTCELLLEESGLPLRRSHDPATGLALIDAGGASWTSLDART